MPPRLQRALKRALGRMGRRGGGGGASVSSDGPQPSDELLDTYFEYFKQLTTLNTAVAFIALVIYREAAGQIGVLGSVLSLSISLVLSLIGMYRTLLFKRGDKIRGDRSLRLLLFYSIITFIGSVIGLAFTVVASMFLAPHSLPVASSVVDSGFLLVGSIVSLRTSL